MIFDGVSYKDYIRGTVVDSKMPIIAACIEFLEKKLGAKIMYRFRDFPFERPELVQATTIAGLLREKGILDSLALLDPVPDEPPFRIWSGSCGDQKKTRVGGASIENDEAALFAVLGEGLERYLWFTQQDYFSQPMRTSVFGISRHGPFISPQRFAAFSQAQRERSAELHLNPEAQYLWVRGTSLVNGKKIYIPGQTVSATVRPRTEPYREPLIRTQTTIGMATWPTLAGARLAGALEVIERDAYMIMWLNQLTMPRVSLASLRAQNSSLNLLLERCERYRLKVHAVRMATDAPTHAVCVVLEDTSGHAPRFALGLKAHRSLVYAVEKAALEALRARRTYRAYFRAGNTWDSATPVEKIGHQERLYYWGTEGHASGLEFLTRGKEMENQSASWEHDTEQGHLGRIIEWCKSNNYECLTISLGISAMNPTPWHVEMVVLPDLQPTYLSEWTRQLGGERLKSIPGLLGYTSREEPFIDAPHPFC